MAYYVTDRPKRCRYCGRWYFYEPQRAPARGRRRLAVFDGGPRKVRPRNGYCSHICIQAARKEREADGYRKPRGTYYGRCTNCLTYGQMLGRDTPFCSVECRDAHKVARKAMAAEYGEHRKYFSTPDEDYPDMWDGYIGDGDWAF